MGLLAVGCTTSGENPDAASSPSPQAEGSPVAAQPFDAPTVPQKDGKDAKTGKDTKTAAKKTNKVAGLLESTDPEERAKQVQAGIRSRAGLDPFASLPANLSFSIPIESDGTNGGGNGGNGGNIASGGRTRIGGLVAGGGQSPLVNISSNGGRGGGGRGIPNISGGGGSMVSAVPNLPQFPDITEVRRPRPAQIATGPVGTNSLGAGNPGLKPLPPLPEPKLAQAVEVTGVVTIGGITQAIIKAPNEPTGRHVEVGQRLSNGQVLVKRIEANAGTDPIVVFEENGQEVSRGVGEKATPEDGSTPTV
jgi:hypothetical protein